MKKICIVIFSALLLATAATAQVDRSHAPEPGPAPAVNIGNPYSFTLGNGLKVFVVENHKMPTVTASLLLKRDPVLERDKAGYVSMAGEILLLYLLREGASGCRFFTTDRRMHGGSNQVCMEYAFVPASPPPRD